MKFRWAAGIFLCVFMLSCASKIIFTYPVAEPSYKQVKQFEILRRIFPNACRFSGRVKLDISGKEMDFVTYTALYGINMRSKGMGEIGLTFFDFLYVNGKTHLLAFPEQIPEKFIKIGPADDLYHIFSVMRKECGLNSCGSDCILLRSDSDTIHVFEFSEANILLRSKEYSKRVLVRECSYNNWKNFEGIDTRIPSNIKLVNHETGYSFELDITEMWMGLKTNNAFILPEGTE
ncbi:MAG: hypothetical protein K9L30_07105 [Desulfobacterales bacterium]|nr:hypothetical protein [Desulfobacterales bacterium]